jgi:single-strand DNA-binding protein
MNHVNLIGKMGTAPTFAKTEEGRLVARFLLSTSEFYCDSKGTTKTRNNNHRISAWGRWVPIIEEYGIEGTRLAIEGKLINRFYQSNGKPACITEVEVNDLIIM